jgi:branched-chain amino acid aminotransferase
MPTAIYFLTPTTLERAPFHAQSFNDIVTHESPNGVYTVSNTFNTTQVLKINEHFDRLEDSARRVNIPLVLDRARVRGALRHMIDAENWGDSRYRITVAPENPTQLLLAIEPFKPLAPDILQNGTRCITTPNSARHNPEAKTTDWALRRVALQEAMPQGVYDTFLEDGEGFILEGLASNFYAIVDGALHTAGSGVLKGISQQIVLEIAPDILPVKLEAVHTRQISQLSEAFLTSSSRGIVPIVEINGIRIGDGKVGQMTQRLRQAYGVWMQAHLEEL